MSLVVLRITSGESHGTVYKSLSFSREKVSDLRLRLDDPTILYQHEDKIRSAHIVTRGADGFHPGKTPLLPESGIAEPVPRSVPGLPLHQGKGEMRRG